MAKTPAQIRVTAPDAFGMLVELVNQFAAKNSVAAPVIQGGDVHGLVRELVAQITTYLNAH